MASIHPRRNRRGGTTYQVRWREGGRHRSFEAPTAKVARKIKGLIEAHGTLPRDWEQRTDDVLTVTDLVRRYIDSREDRVRSDRTIADYRRDLRIWIEPTIGRYAADVVEPDDVQEWVDGIDRAPKTVANLHGLLAASYKWGTHRRENGRTLVGFNPCHETELPARHHVVRGLRAGEWRILYQAACDHSQDVADLLLFLVGTGWRWSEAAALRVWQLDLDGKTPRVEMARIFRRNAANQLVELDNEAKSAAGRRRISLSPAVAQMLRRRTTGAGSGDFVFTSPRGHAWRYNNFRDRHWATANDANPGVVLRARALGLEAPVTLHWLRHTMAALLIENGAHLPGVQRRLGHQSITTTVDTYGTLVEDVPADVLEALDDELFRRTALRAVDDA